MMNPSSDVENDEINKNLLRCGDMVVGMLYVPVQEWCEVFDPACALGRGTQFKELDKPFFGEEVYRV